MTPNVFKWTDFAVADGLRLATILVIALILNRTLRVLTRRLIPVAGAEGLGRIARMHEQHVKTLAGLIYNAGTAVIVVGAILTALPEFGLVKISRRPEASSRRRQLFATSRVLSVEPSSITITRRLR